MRVSAQTMSLKVTYGHGGAETRPFFAQQPADVVPGPVPKLPLPVEIQDLYRSEDTEFYIGSRTFMCPRSVSKHYTFMCEHRQTRVVAFAFTYKGMGHIALDVYDPVTNSVFELEEGGASPMEREERTQSRIALDIDALQRKPFKIWWAEVLAADTTPTGSM